MQAGLDDDAFSAVRVIASSGAKALYAVNQTSVLDVGYHTICPFSSTATFRYAGILIPPIPRDANIFGQFGVLTRTGRDPYSPMGFFDRDVAADVVYTYAGVRSMAESPVCAHVCVHIDGHWGRFVSGPLAEPRSAIFHREPYCVIDRDRLFMMYLVGCIVIFDIKQSSFSVLELPDDLSNQPISCFDYTVAKGELGGIALVHCRGGVMNKWSLNLNSEVLFWELSSTLDLDTAFEAILQNIEIPGAQLVEVGVEWGDTTVQVRSASQDCVHVFFTIGMDAGIFLADLLKGTVSEVPNFMQYGEVGRVLAMEENWPPIV